MLGHGRIKAVGVDRTPLLAQRVLGQVERETIGVVEFEGRRSRQFGTCGQPCHLVFQQFQSAFQRLLEAGFFQVQRFGDQRLGLAQFGIG